MTPRPVGATTTLPCRLEPTVLSAIAGLRGTVLEIGAGSGTNLRAYHDDVRLVAVEPDPLAREALRGHAQGLGRAVETRAGVAEDLAAAGVADGSVDAVVGTYVLCSVDDVARSLAEVRRVLRPGGTYVFAEHVAARPGTWLHRTQRAVGALGVGGCRPDRTSDEAVVDAFEDVTLVRTTARGPVGLQIPVVHGTARA